MATAEPRLDQTGQAPLLPDGNEAAAGHAPIAALFKGNGRVVHGAFSHSYEDGSELFQPFLADVFDDERYFHWLFGDKNFELRCSGTPGSGKTTLAALVASKLRDKFSGGRDAVASIFLQYDLRWNEVSFIEDFLVSVFHQLSAKHVCEAADGDGCRLYVEARRYTRAASVGLRAANRIKLIRQALETCVSALEHSFLIVDGIDRCNAAVSIFLEDEFARLRDKGLKVMTTSRIPCLREPLDTAYYDCDGPGCEDPRNCRICWACENCRTEDSFIVMCAACMKKGLLCENCDKDSKFVQPYDHIDFDISLTSGDAMESFVAWSIEKEHGNLGLESSDQPKPSLSRLGTEIKRSVNPQEARDLVERVAWRAENNIALAIARLELVHSADTVLDTKPVSDRLPPSITALFDAGLRSIISQPEEQRELGLKAIAAVAYAGGHDLRGIKHVDLDRWLREAEMLSSASPVRHVPHRSLEEILEATKGFLIATVPAGEVERFIEAYHEDFVLYASGGYNEALVWATSQLQFDKLLKLQKFSRSKTVQFSKLGSATSEQDRRMKDFGRGRPTVTIKRVGTGVYQFDDTRALKLLRRDTGWA